MWKLLAFKAGDLFLPLFPKRVAYRLADAAAFAVYWLSPATRNAVTDNLRHVLGPEADKDKLNRTVQGVLRNVSRNYIDLIMIPHMKLDEIRSCVTASGWHNLEAALKKGKGVILATAHTGSFDIAAQIFAVRKVKTTVLVEPLKPASLLSHVTRLRETNGVAFVSAYPGVLDRLKQSLQRGEAVLFACDRDIAKNGVRVDFFGEETSLPSVAVLTAMRTGAAIVPIFSLRRGDSQYEVCFEPAIDVVPASKGAVARNIEQVARVLEKYIQSYPEQWVVLSPIWENKG